MPSQFQLGGLVGYTHYRGFISGQHPSPWFLGPCGWLLADSRPITFIPCRGSPGLWDIDIPE